MPRYVASSELPADPSLAFEYHQRRGALDRLIPPWKNVAVESSDHCLEPGSIVVLRIKSGPIKLRWIAEHTEYDPPNSFADVQRSGPFARWEHTHGFAPHGHQRCLLKDTIDYELPLGPIGRLLGGGIARTELETMFAYRHRVSRDDLRLVTDWPQQPLTVAISGASGLVGRNLSAFFRLAGHRVIRLVRSLPDKELPEDEAKDVIAPWTSDREAEKLSGIDAIIHLAGKSIADSRWNDKVKREIRDSRVELTSDLAHRLARLSVPPRVMICASATGIYGDRGSEELNETSSVGDGFLADVACDWERACEPARQAGIRVANARFGIILDPNGGALSKMLTPAKFFGGALGNGRQWWSWIALDDVIGALYHAVQCKDVSGPVNLVSPQPLTCSDFADRLARTVSRRALLPLPAFALRLGVGEMAGPLLLASTKVIPGVLQSSGYQFRFSDLSETLRYCLGKERLTTDA